MSCFLKSLLLISILSKIGVAQETKTLNVLVYSSLLNKGGLGEELQKEAALHKLQLNFSTSKDFAGILGTLRKLKREKKLDSLDAVIGINNAHYKSALDENLIVEGSVYEEATFSLLVNKALLPEKEWPQSWTEVTTKLAKKILIQDPRTSEVGLTWLLNPNISSENAKKIPLKVFPNWSSSFEAFEAKLAPVIWTYSTSAAYFACTNDSKAKNYANLPLPQYPKDKNYIAFLKKSSPPTAEQLKLKELLLSEKVQSSIWEKNWMFPALYPKVIKNMPDCYKTVWFPKDAREIEALSAKELLKRLDLWSL